MIDSRIPMMAQHANPIGAFNDALLAVERSDAIKQRRKLQPMQDKLMQLNLQGAELANNQSQDDALFKSIYEAATDVDYFVKNDDQQNAIQNLTQRAQMLRAQGKDYSHTAKAIQMAQNNWEQFKHANTAVLQRGQQQFGGNANWQKSTDGFSFNPKTNRWTQDPNYAQYQKDRDAAEAAEYDRRVNVQTNASISEDTRKQAVDLSKDAFDQMRAVNSNLANYDQAMSELNNGANTGWFENFFASMTPASIALDNVANQLTLGVLQSVTFGALSEAELNMARQTALPTDMQEAELFGWVKNKKLASEIASDRFNDMARYLSTPGKTLNDWIKYSESQTYRSMVNHRDRMLKKSYEKYKYNPQGKNSPSETGGGGQGGIKVISVEDAE